MINIFVKNQEGTLKTSEGEILNYRVYSDGWVKIEGLNIREDFSNVEDAFKYTQRNQIKF